MKDDIKNSGTWIYMLLGRKETISVYHFLDFQRVEQVLSDFWHPSLEIIGFVAQATYLVWSFSGIITCARLFFQLENTSDIFYTGTDFTARNGTRMELAENCLHFNQSWFTRVEIMQCRIMISLSAR